MSKIKAIDPKIIVNRDVDRPYYSIEYYDTSDNQWHIGYGSYELKNVIEWLDTDFDVIKADVAPVRHGHWTKSKCSVCGDYEFRCSSCGETFWEGGNYATRAHFCPNCGARMDKESEENNNG